MQKVIAISVEKSEAKFYPTQATVTVVAQLHSCSWRAQVGRCFSAQQLSALACALAFCQPRPFLLLQVLLTACKTTNEYDMEAVWGRGSWGYRTRWSVRGNKKWWSECSTLNSRAEVVVLPAQRCKQVPIVLTHLPLSSVCVPFSHSLF